jgi:hypothetical protein
VSIGATDPDGAEVSLSITWKVMAGRTGSA